MTHFLAGIRFIPGAAPAPSLALRSIRISPTRPTKVLRRGLAPRPLLRSGRAMLDSVRVRLTLWYTAVLAVVLVALSLITYFIFWHSTFQRTDANLAELSTAFLTTLDAEIKHQRWPDAFKLSRQLAI